MTESKVIGEKASSVETVTLVGREVALTPFCTYKFQEACRLLAEIVEHFGIKEIMDNLASLPENPSWGQLAIAVIPLLPKILRELPDAAGEFVATCAIPKQRLYELYDEEGGIAAEVRAMKKELLFESNPAEMTHAMAKFMACLRIEDLGNEVKQVLAVFQGLTGTEEPEQPTSRRRRRTG